MKQGRRTAARQLLLGFTLSNLQAAEESKPPPTLIPSPLDEGLTQLLRIRRLHIEALTGGEAASQIRDMIIAAIQSSGLFAITENSERADAFLRGTAEDLVFQEQFQSSESIGIRSGLTTGRSSERVAANLGVTNTENTRIQERKHEAVAAVRIVNKEGDVLWSTTQESLGAKHRGASADVAEKITRQLRSDVERARKLPVAKASN